MNITRNKFSPLKFIKTLTIGALISFSGISNATIVQIQTSYGDIEVNLFDQTTPKTVENFLSYINDSAYDNSVIHRSISGFISQGGGYYFNDEDSLVEVAEKTTVINEPLYSNVHGTIAMAKLGGQPNSATSQWFINLNDNGANLDLQNSGFTVFGQVTEAGMQVMDTIAALSTKNFGGAFVQMPVESTSESNTRANTVVIETIAITDNTLDSAADLSPELNTRINATGNTTSSSSGTGNLGLLWLSVFSLLGLSRNRRRF